MIHIIQRLILLIIIMLSGWFSVIYAQNDSIYTEIRYYGTGCFTIQRGDNALLTDPFISNPSTTQVLFGKVKTDVDYVERYINPATFGKVRMVISGHSHYDHLMDLPYLSRYIPETAPYLVNKTGKHILAFYGLPQQIIAMNDIMGDAQKEGYWYYSDDGNMRAMAFKSQHPPHFAGINLANKKYTADLEAEPLMMNDWQEGKTMAYLVDWLEDDQIAYRIYFSSSLAKAPFGMFPKSILDEHPVDDLFISAALFSDFEAAPKPMIDLCQPKRVILMHWENFFRSKEKQIKELNKAELNKLKRLLNEEYGDAIEIIQPQPLNYY